MANDKQWILHDWSDEDCIKILQQCKQAIMSNGKHKVGKVIIIDMVRENQNGDKVSTETQLFFDLEKKRGSALTNCYLKSMELINEDSASELLQAQTHVWNHIFNFINSMTLKCVVQLGIPDAIHKHGKPMTLSELVSALPIHPSKTQYVHRLMRILVHSGFFSQQNLNGINNDQEVYSLSQSARLLLEDSPLSMRPLLLMLLDPVLTKPWDCLSTWFRNDEVAAFSAVHGKTIWEYAGQDPRLNNLFNEAMAGDSILVSTVIVSKCKCIFEGVNSLVDVGGGIGTMAKAISEAFPHIDCTVFDLPHVLSDLQASKNLKYVAGDMFEAVPPADAVLLKWILHDWSDEDCIKILQQCKQAIMRNGKQKVGKVIIIDMVRENQNGDKVSTETQLFFDLEMMVNLSGMERNEKEWAKLFFDAGFLNYKIHPVLGTRALIELHP
ncbi:hypothetical protein DKX38_020088 [Salix brachista]|uniref:O-methyltransferase domain-containing protein n=1 Tax=Salix brachista TaxID=2182728 RepID=A0A5N5KI56_9ROSI|nr:hypothetical protein DKX38_020088 [Salix brachista]